MTADWESKSLRKIIPRNCKATKQTVRSACFLSRCYPIYVYNVDFRLLKIPENKQTYYLFLPLGQCRGFSSPWVFQEKQTQEKTLSTRGCTGLKEKRYNPSSLWSTLPPPTHAHTHVQARMHSHNLQLTSLQLSAGRTLAEINQEINTHAHTRRNNSNRPRLLCLSAWKASSSQRSRREAGLAREPQPSAPTLPRGR